MLRASAVATGETVTAEELGGADVHTRLSGVADYLATDDADALRTARTIVSTLHVAKPPAFDLTTPEDPRYDPQELRGIVGTDLQPDCLHPNDSGHQKIADAFAETFTGS